MAYSHTELKSLFTLDQYPRSSSYDPVWELDRLMGPNPLWLTETL